MSDFSITAAQRLRLLEGDYKPLVFDTKPVVEPAGEGPRGVEPGDRYVLAWKRRQKNAWKDERGEVFGYCAIRVPLWFITVTSVKRRTEGGWLVRFDVTDNRDGDLWLSRSGDYQWSRRGAVDELPVAPSDETRRKAIAERDHLRRLQRHAAELRERAQWKRDRRAA